jgi:hypothetical protein
MPACIDCSKCDMKSERTMARLGYGRCELETQVGKFKPVDRVIECKQYEALTAEQAEARRNWLNGRR